MEKLKLDKAVIVEGKYDKIKLQSILDTTIITIDGYKIYKDKEKKELIKKLAQTKGIILATDSDTAGFRLRSYIKSITNNGKIENVYIPQIKGKEKRKEIGSKEGTLGVEGIDADLLREIFKKFCCEKQDSETEKKITKADFYEDGFIGKENSSENRQKLIKKLGLPKYMTTNTLLDIINLLMDYDEYKKFVYENLTGGK